MRGSISLSSGARALGCSRPRRALSRFYLRRRGQRLRPCASLHGRGADRAGHEALARLQSLPHPGRRAAGRPAVRLELRRYRVLPELRRRSHRMRDQDGAQIPVGERQAGALPHYHLRRRLPRPHARGHRRHRQQEISRRLRPAGRRLRPGGLRRSRSDQEGDRAGDRRHHDRAGDGRGRRARAAACLPQSPARAVRQAWPAADFRRDPDRHRPHRRPVLLSAHRRDARHHDAGQGAGRRLSGRRLPRHRRSLQGHDRRHARLDLRRQSARHGGRQCRHRSGDRRRLHRKRAPEFAAAQAAAGRAEGPARLGDCRGARRGPADRPAHGAAGRRHGGRAARREDDHRRRRRQRGAAAAAAHHRRSGDRGSGFLHRPRLRAARAAACAASRRPRHERQRRAPFPRPHRHPEADAGRHDRPQPRDEGRARARRRSRSRWPKRRWR